MGIHACAGIYNELTGKNKYNWNEKTTYLYTK